MPKLSFPPVDQLIPCLQKKPMLSQQFTRCKIDFPQIIEEVGASLAAKPENRSEPSVFFTVMTIVNERPDTEDLTTCERQALIDAIYTRVVSCSHKSLS